MSGWEIAGAALVAALAPCVLVALRGGARDALVALELAGTLTAAALMVLSQAYSRQPFLDLAIVLAVCSNVGALMFARLMERDL
jgi:multicomponent Na+:H+ antiporter subunit F